MPIPRMREQLIFNFFFSFFFFLFYITTPVAVCHGRANFQGIQHARGPNFQLYSVVFRLVYAKKR
ncbi:hypothetical protein BDZ91DRAFT_729158 [Kalaharituber pfeilii]|nr:hypothetical protein BDZ91DRAFT_729158 [Kalaharituber pfeilii]